MHVITWYALNAFSECLDMVYLHQDPKYVMIPALQRKGKD